VWIAASLAMLLLHYAWEMGQARFFADFAATPFLRHAFTCLLASLGDLAIATLAYFVTAAAFRRLAWPLRPNWFEPALLWMALGLLAAVVIERRCVAAGRWAYSSAMPIVFGIGVLPLLQWVVVPAAALALFRWFAARATRRRSLP